MNDLAEARCVPCRGDEPLLTDHEIAELKSSVPDWEVVERDGVRQLERVFRFRDFVQALAFTNQVGKIAQKEDHHPTLVTQWGKVTVSWWTHKLHGLHRNDFVMAAKTDRQYEVR